MSKASLLSWIYTNRVSAFDLILQRERTPASLFDRHCFSVLPLECVIKNVADENVQLPAQLIRGQLVAIEREFPSGLVRLHEV